MKFRLSAFGLHLAGSVCALSLILGGLYLGWYRWPGWYLTGAAHILIIVLIVDVALGPTLTLIIANPRKPRRELARDIGIIVAVQIAALIYGAATLWHGRPLYYTFSSDRLEMVQASAIKSAEIALARRENPDLAPHWFDRPRWVWAPLPDDPVEANRIVNSSVFGGDDVIDMPRYFRPWEKGLPQLRERLATIEDMKSLSRTEKQSILARLSREGIPADRRNALIMWGNTRRVLVLFDLPSLRISTILKPD
jgi:hypothetical protein